MKMLLTIAPTLLLVVYGQLMTKWRVEILGKANSTSENPVFTGLIGKIYNFLSDPFIISAYVTALMASITWIFVLERYPISSAFPIYIGLTSISVFLGGVFLFGETYSFMKILSAALIIIGVIIGVQET
ncbi:MAG: hypothetical protein ACNI26_07815 [Terasakiella sp.]|uniref:hypothetical protein n=1 Tax=unclassified Terasakiella TaxID=2614952 RepID=UPI003AA7EB56